VPIATGTKPRRQSRRASNLAGRGPAPIVSRRSSKANARRERERYQRHQLTESHIDRMYREQEKRERADRRAEQGPRHWYGAWSPYGVSAFMGGHPGRAVRHAHRKVRRHVRRIIRGTDD
jgi:hypothetical protein